MAEFNITPTEARDIPLTERAFMMASKRRWYETMYGNKPKGKK